MLTTTGLAACQQVFLSSPAAVLVPPGSDLTLPCTVANHASALYARNLVALLKPTLADGVLTLDTEDELIAGCLVAQDGGIRRGDVLTPGAK